MSNTASLHSPRPVTPDSLLSKWLERSRTNQLQHYAAASYFSGLHNRLGIPSAILAAVVGTTVFASLQKQISLGWQITVGAMSILAAIMTGLQTYLRYSELAEKHRSIGASYASLRHHIEVLLAKRATMSDEQVSTAIDQVENTLKSMTDSAPTVPPKISSRVVATAKSESYFGKSVD